MRGMHPRPRGCMLGLIDAELRRRGRLLRRSSLRLVRRGRLLLPRLLRLASRTLRLGFTSTLLPRILRRLDKAFGAFAEIAAPSFTCDASDCFSGLDSQGMVGEAAIWWWVWLRFPTRLRGRRSYIAALLWGSQELYCFNQNRLELVTAMTALSCDGRDSERLLDTPSTHST